MPISLHAPRLVLPLAIALAGAASPVGAAEADDDSPLDQLRSLSIEDLINIEVTATARQPEKLIHAASAIEAITSEDIRRFSPLNLPQAIALSTGAQVARAEARTWAITARGFNTATANKMQVMLDGRLLFTPLYSGVFWDAQSTMMEDIDRIEVVRGPGAALWGSNAVNGVISIITKEASETQGWLASAGAGDFHESFVNVRYGGRLGEATHFRVYGQTLTDNELSMRNGEPGDDGRRMRQAGFRLDAYANADNRFTLQGDLYEGSHGIADEAEDGALSGGNLLGRWNRILNAATEFELRAYYDRTERYLPDVFSEDRETFDLDFQSTWEGAKENKLVWGANFNLSTSQIEGHGGFSFAPAERDTRSRSAFAQYQHFLLPDRLGVIAGARFERNTLGGTDIQPSARIFWRGSDDSTLWAGVSRAARRPTQIDTDVFFRAATGATLAGSPDFESEKVTAYELGYRAQLLSDLSFDLALFRNEYEDLRSLEFVPGSFSDFYVDNLLKAQSQGAELTVSYRLTDNWTAQAGATLLDVEFRAQPGASPFGGMAEGNDPDHWFHVRSYLRLGRDWSLAANLRHTGSLPNPVVPSHTDLDLRAAWQMNDNCELSIAGQNLLDPIHPEFAAQTPGGLQVPRHFYAKATWRY